MALTSTKPPAPSFTEDEGFDSVSLFHPATRASDALIASPCMAVLGSDGRLEKGVDGCRENPPEVSELLQTSTPSHDASDEGNEFLEH